MCRSKSDLGAIWFKGFAPSPWFLRTAFLLHRVPHLSFTLFALARIAFAYIWVLLMLSLTKCGGLEESQPVSPFCKQASREHLGEAGGATFKSHRDGSREFGGKLAEAFASSRGAGAWSKRPGSADDRPHAEARRAVALLSQE